MPVLVIQSFLFYSVIIGSKPNDNNVFTVHLNCPTYSFNKEKLVSFKIRGPYYFQCYPTAYLYMVPELAALVAKEHAEAFRYRLNQKEY